MAEPADEAVVTHIAKGAEDVESRSTDEVSQRLKSFDLRRHRMREQRVLTSGVVAAVLITALLFLAALYASRHHWSGSTATAAPSGDA